MDGLEKWMKPTESEWEYAVLVRTLNTKLGTVKHAAIRNATETDITWVKNSVLK